MPDGGNENAIDLLLDDHRAVEALFDRFEDESDPDAALGILRKIAIELAVHARIEEELFYPAARSVLGNDAKALLDEAAVEHASLKKMIIDLSVLTAQDGFFRAKVKVLGSTSGITSSRRRADSSPWSSRREWISTRSVAACGSAGTSCCRSTRFRSMSTRNGSLTEMEDIADERSCKQAIRQ